MISIARAAQRWVPGTWFPWVFGPRAVRGAVIVCPSCGRGMSIGGDGSFGSSHAIATGGSVSPSVVCPHGCGWHVFVRLEGWRDATA